MYLPREVIFKGRILVKFMSNVWIYVVYELIATNFIFLLNHCRGSLGDGIESRLRIDGKPNVYGKADPSVEVERSLIQSTGRDVLIEFE